MRFYKNNVELNLSEKERSLLLLFVRHPQQVFTKDMIYEQVWGTTIAIDDNGALLVEREGGRRAALQHGEVSIRPTKTE